MEQKKTNGWKITAIIFIALFVITILSFLWIANNGLEMIDKENECAINICSTDQAYNFDYYTDVCYCYEDNKVVHQEFIK